MRVATGTSPRKNSFMMKPFGTLSSSLESAGPSSGRIITRNME